MARINVDEKWFAKDPRRNKFIKAVGEEERADGLALKFWLLGQEAHACGKLVNRKAFLMMPFAKEFLQCELAEEREGGIYIKGSKRRAEFLRAMVEGGRKGGAQKSTKKAQAAKLREHKKRLQREASSEITEKSTSPHKPTPQKHKGHKHHSHSHSHSHSHVQSQIQAQEEMHIGAIAPHPADDGARPTLVEIWNENRGTLPECKSWKGERLKKIRARWKEQTPESWVETVKRMAKSDFCCGKGQTGWRADFDFFIKPGTWAKVNEGRYDNNKGAGPSRTQQVAKYDNLDRLEKSWAKKGADNEV